jgi:hypothetical protein
MHEGREWLRELLLSPRHRRLDADDCAMYGNSGYLANM